MTGIASLVLASVLAPAQCPVCGAPPQSYGYSNGNGVNLSFNMGQPPMSYGMPSTYGFGQSYGYAPASQWGFQPQSYALPVVYGGCNGGQYQNGFSASSFRFGRRGMNGYSMQSYGQQSFPSFAGGAAFGGMGLR